MIDRQGGFQLTRTAAGKIPAPRKSREDFPVTVAKGIQKFQVKRDRKWHTVCAVPEGERGQKNLTHHYGTVLGRKLGKDFRFIVQAK